MKVKEIDRTANIAWSPAAHHPIYLAAGTAAQQLDATFSTTAALEIYGLNLTEPGLDMCMKGSVVSDFRFHKVVWGCEGMKTSELSSGVIVGGADGGNIMIYDASKLIQGESALLHQNTKHTGPVHSLDFNKFQDCLLASGASESEIFIWDLNNPSAPVTLGAKSQPLEDVTCVSWNCQVQHILASTFPGRCVVWDLRKNEPIIKVSDSSSRLRCKVVCWHPEVATQLCLASEDDHSPVIQLWDLRFATSPLKTLEHHQRGVLSIAWCQQDPDLLLSCGKDNKILCWNPNSNVENGEVLCELPTGNQWSFDVAWCPRNPAIIANSSCDGHVSVFSLMGGQQQVQCSSKIAESFPGSDTSLQPANVDSIHRHISVPLQKPPKWVRIPVGASFGFGGKLVSFVNDVSGSSQSGDGPTPKLVHITQVVTEPELLKRAERLESSLANGNLFEFCQNKIDNSQTEDERISWSFLQVAFNSTPRGSMLSLLGYNYDQVKSEITEILKEKGFHLEEADLEEFSNLTVSQASEGLDAFDNIAMKVKDETDEEPIFIQTDPQLNIESSMSDLDGLISQALLTGNIKDAVNICIQDKRWTDAIILAQAGGAEVLERTRKLYFKSVNTNASKLISAVVSSDWLSMVKTCNISCWKEILAAILTYSKPEDLVSLCEILGNRLESEPSLQQNAPLCYISAGNVELLARSWMKIHGNLNVTSLQTLIEQVMILRRAVEELSGPQPLETGVLSTLLGQYAELLATQGSLSSAVTYLVDPNERTLAILRDRIYQSLGHPTPCFPFQRMDVRRSGSVSQTPQQFQQQQPQERRRSSAHLPQQPQYSYGGPTQPVHNSFAYPPASVPQYQQPLPPLVPPPPGNMMAPMTPPVAPSVLTPAPVPPPVPPPADKAPKSRQNSGGPHHLSQRYPRHLHDPSVYSENSFQPSQPFYQPQTFPQPTPNAFPSQPQPNFYSPPDPNVQANFPYAPVSNTGPTYPPTSYDSYPPAPPSLMNPVSNQQAPPPPVSLPSCYNEVKPGWNDPPPLKQQPTKPPTSSLETQAPITRPFPDMPAMEPQLPPQNAAPGGYFTPSFPQQPPSGYMNVNQQAPNEIPEAPKAVPRPAPEPVKERGPIPPEHQVLQDIFEDLRRQCQQVATNPTILSAQKSGEHLLKAKLAAKYYTTDGVKYAANWRSILEDARQTSEQQTRRKLDDVAKKLENLYDKLRDNTISNTLSQGLHQIVQSIMQGDYPTALAIHGQLVSTANFSEISGFMPSLKVLLQTASQLNVFLR